MPLLFSLRSLLLLIIPTPHQASGAKLHRAAVQPAHAPKLLNNNSHGSTAGQGLWQADLQLEPPF